MKRSILCTQVLMAVVVLVESSVPFSSQTTQTSSQTGANTANCDTSSDVVTSLLETNDTTDRDGDVAQEITEYADHYAAVGILDLSSDYDGSRLLIQHRLHDGSLTNEWWGVKKNRTTHDASKLVMSSVVGISCNGIIIDLPGTIVDVLSRGNLSNADECLEILDDILLSLADSLVHRIQTVGSTDDTAIQVMIVVQGEKECNEDVSMSKTTDYIGKYLDRAISKLQSQTSGRKGNESSIVKIDIEVEISLDSVADTAVQLVGNLVSTKSLNYVSSIQMIRDKLELIDDDTLNVSEHSDDTPNDDSTSFRDKAELAIAMILSTAEDDMYEIEIKMDDTILEDDDEKVPMPEFGSDANSLLMKVSEAYLNLIPEANSLTNADREWIAKRRIEALKNVAAIGLHRLYRLHLQNLRDHFGRTYEKILDRTSAMDLREMEEEIAVQSRDQLRREGAKRAEEGFLKAAFLSIPAMCQQPQMELGDLYSCTEALRGLLEDMYEATLSRGIEEEEWNDVMDMSAEETARLYHGNNDINSAPAERVGLRELIKKIKNKRAKRGPAKWYERLAAKALVVGVNYVQGWIVLQTLRREARRRDLTMPKFPLF